MPLAGDRDLSGDTIFQPWYLGGSKPGSAGLCSPRTPAAQPTFWQRRAEDLMQTSVRRSFQRVTSGRRHGVPPPVGVESPLALARRAFAIVAPDELVEIEP